MSLVTYHGPTGETMMNPDDEFLKEINVNWIDLYKIDFEHGF
ncbi:MULTISPECIES: hypothetical protein [Paenibacillus]